MSCRFMTAPAVLASIASPSLSSPVAIAAPPRGPSASASPTKPTKSAPKKHDAPPRPMVAVAMPPPPPSAPPPEPAALPPPPIVQTTAAQNDVALPPPEGAVQKRVAITLNPMPMVIGRFGGNVEVLVAPHHAITGSLFVQTFPRGIIELAVPSAKNLTSSPAPLVGGELGYRFYSGRSSPSGLFVGPSFLAMPFAYPRVNDNLDVELTSFHAFGAALDIGAQLVTSGGFTFGGGIGVMALAYTPPASITPPAGFQVPTYPEPHVLPRLLLAAGWAF